MCLEIIDFIRKIANGQLLFLTLRIYLCVHVCACVERQLNYEDSCFYAFTHTLEINQIDVLSS